MKKGWKVFWTVCAVLAATGLFMTAAGAALGGLSMLSNRDELEKLSEITSDGENLSSGYKAGEPDGDMITAYEEVDEIALDLSELVVSVVPSDSSAIVVDTSRLREDVRETVVISQDGSELKIETDGHHRFQWYTGDPGMLYISIPEGENYSSFSAEIGAGLLEMTGISAGELSLEAGAGQIIAEGFYADVLEAECGAGQISLQGEVVQHADINCDIGEVLFTLPGDAEAYDYGLSCSAGELVVGDEAYSGLRNKMKIDNNSGCMVEAECRVGRIEIMFE